VRQVLVKLEKNGAETFEMLKLLLVMKAFVLLTRVNGSGDLKEAERPSMTIQKPGDHQRARKWLVTCNKSQVLQ
jgi:hypothetical protein